MKQLRWLVPLVAALAFLAAQGSAAFAAPPDETPSAHPVKCNINFVFPEARLSTSGNGPRYVHSSYRVMEDCRLVEVEHVELKELPRGAGSQQSDEPMSVLAAPAGVNGHTADLFTYELDVLGIKTNGLRTTQAWTWMGGTVSLSNWSNLSYLCCGWWYKWAPESFSNGYDNPSHTQGWANGNVTNYCNGAAFCPGSGPQDVITWHNWLHLYSSGGASMTGTSYEGTIIPGGSLDYDFVIRD